MQAHAGEICTWKLALMSLLLYALCECFEVQSRLLPSLPLSIFVFQVLGPSKHLVAMSLPKMTEVDPTGKRLLSLPGRFLKEIFSYNFPVNMLRAAAACQHLHSTLAQQLRDAVRFKRTDWVILGELEATESNIYDYKDRAGQFIGVNPQNRSQCNVEVDKWISRHRRRLAVADGGCTCAVESQTVQLSSFKLYKYCDSGCGMMQAVRLHANGEVAGQSGDYSASEVKIPRELSAFTWQQGQCPPMADIGRPLLVRRVIPLVELDCWGDRHCDAHAKLHMKPWDLEEKPIRGCPFRTNDFDPDAFDPDLPDEGGNCNPDPFVELDCRGDRHCDAHAKLHMKPWDLEEKPCSFRINDFDPDLPDEGPVVVAWLDRAEFTLDHMEQVWRFITKCRTKYWESQSDSEQELGWRPTSNPYMLSWLGWDEPAFEPATQSLPGRNLHQKRLDAIWQESTQEPVIEQVLHEEIPARIDPSEARAVVEVQQESTIQHGSIPSSVADLACVVTFGRAPEAFDRALAQSQLGQQLQGIGQDLKPRWANGAKILVEGLTEESWATACREAGLTLNLHPSDAVLPANSLDNILAELRKIPKSSRPRVKAGREIISIPDLSLFADLSEGRQGSSSLSSLNFTENPTLSSQAASSESSGWSAFTDGILNKILHVPLPPGYTARTFIHEPEDAVITPRSVATQSDSAALGTFANPRFFQDSPAQL